MSSIKKYLFEVQSKRADEWIRSHLENKDADEDSEEYQFLAEEYSNYMDYLDEKAKLDIEIAWLKQNDSSLLHKYLLDQLKSIENITKENLKNDNLYIAPQSRHLITKMAYAYTITLLESFLGDTIKTLVTDDTKLLMNLIEKSDEFSKEKYTLAYFSKFECSIERIALNKLSNVLYHKLNEVIKLFENTLNKKININLTEINKIINTRHDIIHRNGVSQSGDILYITIEQLENAINVVKEFSTQIQRNVNQATSA